MIKADASFELRNHLINIHQFTKTLSKWSLYMQSFRIRIQLFAHFADILYLLVIVCLHSPDTDLKSPLQLIQHRLFRCFTGM